MSYLQIAYTYGAMLAAFLAVDLLWLGVVAKGFYQTQLGSFMRSAPNWGAALLFYALFVVGVLFFCVLPAHEKSSLSVALINGALFGFFTYMTFELTNYAVIKDWPLAIVPVDIVWGVILASVVSVAGYYVASL